MIQFKNVEQITFSPMTLKTQLLKMHQWHCKCVRQTVALIFVDAWNLLCPICDLLVRFSVSRSRLKPICTCLKFAIMCIICVLSFHHYATLQFQSSCLFPWFRCLQVESVTSCLITRTHTNANTITDPFLTLLLLSWVSYHRLAYSYRTLIRLLGREV